MGVYSGSTLSPEQQALYETRLNDAEEAMHKLATGQAARVFVDQNGERVEFNPQSMAQLRGYIMQLRVKLGWPTGIIGPASPWAL